ncbi:hypothetical protein GCM10018790_65570 [Kitasatospora xanthocidica]|uniref:hypothetical protein n=1 Tax=Kitasatospora xanthocidica TaxID=83382 RepID=UPI001674CCD0|nr:hypothetical protein [Kitasatospora xanthocidica]GHF78459.1 hypothetical protein GCM10018790_65570 [Kitasatospora xanthocidica]
MIRKHTAVRLAAVIAVTTAGLGLSTGMAVADTTYPANVPGCAGGMVVSFYSGHDHVRGYATSTMGDSCSVVLQQSNGNSSSNWTNILHDTAWTDTLLDAGITSHVVVCNGDTGRCATSASY